MAVTVSVPVRGMHCAACVRTIEEAARSSPGVLRADVNFAEETAQLDVDPGSFDPRALDRALRERGYRLHPRRFQVRVSGLAGPSEALERELAALPGIVRAQLPYGADVLTLDTIPGLFDRRAAETVLHRAGVRSRPVAVAESDDELKFARLRAIFAVLGTSLLMGLMYFHVHVPLWVEMTIGAMVVFGCGAPFHLGLVRSVRRLSPDMNTLVSLGSTAAFAASFVPGTDVRWFETGAMIVAVVLVGRWLELRARRGTREAVRALAELTPPTATVLHGDLERTVAIAELAPGDIVLVRPGERVPADGNVIDGEGEVEESMFTGESAPVRRGPGDAVIGGSINRFGALRIRVTATGERTVLAQIVRIVREAQGSKAPIQRIADRWAAVFVPVVLGLAAATLAAWLFVDPSFALGATLAVLLVACPCALGLATPTAVVVATGRAARLGILIKNAEVLERVARLRTVAFDKTGTLTAGRPVVRQVVPADGLTREEVLRTAATVERSSEHPIARAIVAAAPAVEPAPGFEARPGYGAFAGDVAVGSRAFMELIDVRVDPAPGHVYVSREGKLVGSIEVADAVREDAPPVVNALRARSLSVAMITGDDVETARRVAQELGIKDVHAGVMPADKAARVRNLEGPVAMVGDGVNDAPALAAADVGVAVAAGTDIAVESASVVLVRGGLARLPVLVDLARAARRIMHQNFAWAFAYNALLIPVAAGLLRWTGVVLDPMLAAAAMALSSVTVVLNSLRLRRAP